MSRTSLARVDGARRTELFNAVCKDDAAPSWPTRERVRQYAASRDIS